MENVVLGLLMVQSLTLYDLNRAFNQGISMFYSASYGSLQVAVRNLLIKGLIVFEARVDNGRHKKVYSITNQGRDAFHQWMLAEIPESKVEVTALSKIYFLGLIRDNAQKRQIIIEILHRIETVEAGLEKIRQETSRYEIPAYYQDMFKFQMKTLEYGILSHKLARDWAESILKEIESEHDFQK